MYISYNKLWKLLIDKNMNKQDLQEKAKIASGTIAKMGRGEFVSMDVLYRIARALDVDFGDIVSIYFKEV